MASYDEDDDEFDPRGQKADEEALYRVGNKRPPRLRQFKPVGPAIRTVGRKAVPI